MKPLKIRFADDAPRNRSGCGSVRPGKLGGRCLIGSESLWTMRPVPCFRMRNGSGECRSSSGARKPHNRDLHRCEFLIVWPAPACAFLFHVPAALDLLTALPDLSRRWTARRVDTSAMRTRFDHQSPLQMKKGLAGRGHRRVPELRSGKSVQGFPPAQGIFSVFHSVEFHQCGNRFTVSQVLGFVLTDPCLQFVASLGKLLAECCDMPLSWDSQTVIQRVSEC